MSEQNNQFPDNNPGYGQQSPQPEQQSYQQGFDQQNQQSQQNQAQGQPYIPAPQQGQWAPSAYSAPGYGYPPQPPAAAQPFRFRGPVLHELLHSGSAFYRADHHDPCFYRGRLPCARLAFRDD